MWERRYPRARGRIRASSLGRSHLFNIVGPSRLAEVGVRVRSTSIGFQGVPGWPADLGAESAQGGTSVWLGAAPDESLGWIPK